MSLTHRSGHRPETANLQQPTLPAAAMRSERNYAPSHVDGLDGTDPVATLFALQPKIVAKCHGNRWRNGEDLFQTTALRLLGALTTENVHASSPHAQAGFIAKIARNAHIDNGRRATNRWGTHRETSADTTDAQSIKSFGSTSIWGTSTNGFEETVELRSDLVQALQHALNAGVVSEQDLELIIDAHYIGMSTAQLADRYGMAKGTVKSRLSRTRAALRGHAALAHLRPSTYLQSMEA